MTTESAGQRSPTTYKLDSGLGDEIRDINRRMQKRHGFKGHLTTIQKVLDAALESYMPTLRAIDRTEEGDEAR